jgi:hypothetical protein
MTHRPTTIQLFLDHCPAAVAHYERGTPQDRRIFGTGTAAHEVLHALGEGRSVDETCERLITIGRTGQDAEGPLHPDQVFAGRELALAWVEAFPLSPSALYEQRFAFDTAWQPTDGEPYFATRIDVVDFYDDTDEDDFAHRIAVVEDYKSSWQATDDELDTLQRRAQAVCAWLAYPDATAIVLRVSSLRRRQRFERRIDLDEDGVALLTQWRGDLSVVMRALDSDRTARPSPACGGCPYAGACDAARTFRGGVDVLDVVREWQTLQAAADGLEPLVREAATDAPLVVDGFEVGALSTEKRVAVAGAGAEALAEWLRRGGVQVDEHLAGLLASWEMAVGAPGVQLLEKMGRALNRTKPEREAWVAERVRTVRAPRFGCRRVDDGGPKPAKGEKPGPVGDLF